MRVRVLVTDGVFDSGLSAVLDVLDTANQLRAQVEQPPSPWEVSTVGTRRRVTTGAGHTVTTSRPDEPADVLVIPAVGIKQPEALIAEVSSTGNRPVRRMIAEARDQGIDLAGACTGTFFLAEAGVLDGMTATTTWWLGPAFRQRYPAVRLTESHTVVHDDRITTAGAAFAHIDLALVLVHRQSPALADLVARYLLIGDRSSQAAFAIPTLLAQHNPHLTAFERWVRERLAEPIQISAAATAIGLSERSLQRLTSATLGLSPIEFVNDVRLDHATFLLRTTKLSVDTIAGQVGFRNASTLRGLVRRRRSATIAELRR
jgi:transcriptional regulator GlxA family with amidase domain